MLIMTAVGLSMLLPVVTYNFLQFFFNRSDGQMNGASTSGSIHSGFDSDSGQTNDVKIGIHSFPVWRSALKGHCGASRRVVGKST